MESKLAELMKPSNILPEEFDGTFYFTNDSDEEFIGKWGGKEYHFAPRSTSPIIITTETPLNVQQIRKKFARDWAEAQYGKSEAFEKLKALEHNPDGTARLNSIHMANSYSESDLIELIHRCLKPLPKAKTTVSETFSVPIEEKLSTDDQGELNTAAVATPNDLRDLATGDVKKSLKGKLK
jgi:hypothetical protein